MLPNDKTTLLDVLLTEFYGPQLDGLKKKYASLQCLTTDSTNAAHLSANIETEFPLPYL